MQRSLPDLGLKETKAFSEINWWVLYILCGAMVAAAECR
jgi:hypothetical protein